MVQAHAHVNFFTIRFTKDVATQKLYLCMKLLQSNIIFKERNDYEVSSD